ncbi:MAG: hypothetical protein D6693_09195, partial [Planctomycetota bacterium]
MAAQTGRALFTAALALLGGAQAHAQNAPTQAFAEASFDDFAGTSMADITSGPSSAFFNGADLFA